MPHASAPLALNGRLFTISISETRRLRFSRVNAYAGGHTGFKDILGHVKAGLLDITLFLRHPAAFQVAGIAEDEKNFRRITEDLLCVWHLSPPGG